MSAIPNGWREKSSGRISGQYYFSLSRECSKHIVIGQGATLDVAKTTCIAQVTAIENILGDIEAMEEKQRLFDFVKNDIMPLVIEQSGLDSERARLCRLLYFVLRNRTVENWGPRELTMADAMRLP